MTALMPSMEVQVGTLDQVKRSDVKSVSLSKPTEWFFLVVAPVLETCQDDMNVVQKIDPLRR